MFFFFFFFFLTQTRGCSQRHMAPKHAKGTKSEPGTSENEEASIKSGPPMPWTGEVHTTNTVAGRCYHTSVLFDGKLILIGGWSGNGAQHAQEVHAYDFGTNTWATVEALGEPHPGTSQASAADVGNAMLFFGGWNGTTRVAKATLLQLESMQWSDLPNHRRQSAAPHDVSHLLCRRKTLLRVWGKYCGRLLFGHVHPRSYFNPMAARSALRCPREAVVPHCQRR